MGNIHFIENTYENLKALGFVDNQYDFSVMCGRTPTWFSAIKARNLSMTTDAVLTLSYNISRKAENVVDASTHDKAISLSKTLIERAQAQIGAKLSRYSGCSLV